MARFRKEAYECEFKTTYEERIKKKYIQTINTRN